MWRKVKQGRKVGTVGVEGNKSYNFKKRGQGSAHWEGGHSLNKAWMLASLTSRGAACRQQGSKGPDASSHVQGGIRGRIQQGAGRWSRTGAPGRVVRGGEKVFMDQNQKQLGLYSE